MLPFLRWVKNHKELFFEGNHHGSMEENKSGKKEKQLPLKKTLIFLFLDFLRGIAMAVFRRKHNK